MPQTRWTKGQTIVNSDAYNLAGDLATQVDTLNVVVPVASDTEEAGLTPPQGKYAGMLDVRTDLAGLPLKVYDGSAWKWGARVERIDCTTSDATWTYQVHLHRTTEPGGKQLVTASFIVDRNGGGAFTLSTTAWTELFSAIIPSGWRPQLNVFACGGYDFASSGAARGAVLLMIDPSGNAWGMGVTGTVYCGSPTRLSATASWSL